MAASTHAWRGREGGEDLIGWGHHLSFLLLPSRSWDGRTSCRSCCERCLLSLDRIGARAFQERSNRNLLSFPFRSCLLSLFSLSLLDPQSFSIIPGTSSPSLRPEKKRVCVPRERVENFGGEGRKEEEEEEED